MDEFTAIVMAGLDRASRDACFSVIAPIIEAARIEIAVRLRADAQKAAAEYQTMVARERMM